MGLDDVERQIVITKAKRMSEPQALKYMEEQGIKISISSYQKKFYALRDGTKKRLLEICKHMEQRHMDRIDELNTINTLLWKLLDNSEITIVETIRVLRELRELQPYISAYDESTAGVIEEVIENFGKENRDDKIVDISQLGRENQTEIITTKTN